MLLFVTVENKKFLNGSQIGHREKVVLLEEHEKRTVILKAKFSSSITSGGKNRAWQEIANIVNAGNLPPVCNGVCVTLSSVFCVMFCTQLFEYPFSFLLAIELSILQITPLRSTNLFLYTFRKLYNWITCGYSIFYMLDNVGRLLYWIVNVYIRINCIRQSRVIVL